jgi:elongation factor G
MTNKIDQVRNLGLIGHSGCGKTSLAEAVLYNSGSINRLGKVDDGTSTMDFEPEEIKRKITLQMTFHPYSWNSKKFNLIDTPGENDFLSEVKIGLQAAETAIIVIDAVGSIKVGTEKVWTFAKNYNLPGIIFINLLDRERADFYKVLEEMESTFSIKATPIFLPVGKENNFTGLVNLINQKAYIYQKDNSGSFSEESIPDSMKDIVAKWREKVLENIVEADDEIMEKYLGGEELSTEEIEKTLMKGVKSNQIKPIIPGSATLNIGVK